MTPADPVIDEIREIRHRMSEQCGHDPAKLVEFFQKLQEQYRDRLVPTPDASLETEAEQLHEAKQ